ncbi:FadR/GntR family transcriptional regulator [Guggenheimella bovis]
MQIGNRPERVLLYQEVVEDLYKIIDAQNIQPGEKLPSERELIEYLQVSRNVLREAFHVLEARGVVISRQGKGRFLREQPKEIDNMRYDSLSKNLERYSMVEAYQVRQALEVHGIGLLIMNASDDDIVEIERAYKKLDAQFHATGKTQGEFELHRLYAEKTGNQFLTRTLEIVISAINEMMYGKFYDVLENYNFKDEMLSHKKIIEAIRERDVEKARKLMFEHLQIVVDEVK